MGSKCSVIALAFMASLCLTAFALGVEADYSTQDMSGNQISQDVQGEGTNDNSLGSDLSFRNEDLFVIRKDTGMSPNVPGKGVRTPVVAVGIASAAGSWAFTLNDVVKSYLKLDLYQTTDAVFGSGELAASGAVTPVTAGGSILGDRLALFVVPTGSQNMYRFSLTIKPGSMDGEYVFTAPGITQPGIAFGSLLSPLPVTASAQHTVPAAQTVVAQQAASSQPVA
ncbi:MAG: hypothetical protein A4E49_00727 [Methanosaeta sp. PtaU1.Bin112]|nr:MAG: hypothetical protein A4E49_00727 [Methanosaeta sp. PtaU1.Bin112]